MYITMNSNNDINDNDDGNIIQYCGSNDNNEKNEN